MKRPRAEGLSGRLRDYWSLTKSLQTGLLLLSGLAGYMSGRCPVLTWPRVLALAGSLFLAVGGSTVLNMVCDRDIDARMARTAGRPLPAGRVSPGEALILGLSMAALGVIWAAALAPLYGALVFAGLFFDVAVYTLWLKRRTPFSIALGGLAGGMPALAGRCLAVCRVDAVGLLLCLAVLFWIPTHILTFAMRHDADYRRAGIPTFPAVYGFRPTRWAVAGSSLAVTVTMAGAAALIGLAWGYLRLLAALGAGLLGLAAFSLARPSKRVNLSLFKYASVYMLGSLLLITLEAL